MTHKNHKINLYKKNNLITDISCNLNLSLKYFFSIHAKKYHKKVNVILIYLMLMHS